MKKSQLSEAYEKYLWPKCSRTTYYERIRKWMNFIEALKPVNHNDRYKPKQPRSKKFQKELEWYQAYKWDKPNRARFYQRLYQWWTRDEAIKLDAPIHRTFKFQTKKNCYIRPVTPIVKKEAPQDYSEIKIRYSKEEANAIRKEYLRMMDDLEWQYHTMEDTIEAKEIYARLEKLKQEFGVFSKANTEKDF